MVASKRICGPYFWTDARLEELRTHAHLSNKELSLRFGRSVRSIANQKCINKIVKTWVDETEEVDDYL